MSQDADDHPIEISPAPSRVEVLFGGEVVADTSRAQVMRETVYPPIYYIPREDARMAAFEPSDHTTKCPFKGTASYFSLKADGQGAENAVWSYETPFERVGEIAGHLAFYPRYVTFRIDGKD